MTTESTTEPTEEQALGAVDQAEKAPEVENDSANPADTEKKVLSTGMEERVWSGMKFWHCPRCGSDTFDLDEAERHICKGRVVKPYKGD